MNAYRDAAISEDESRLLITLLNSVPLAVAISSLESETDLIVALEAKGYLVVLPDDDDEPRVMLDPILALKAGFEPESLAGAWVAISPVLPETRDIVEADHKRGRIRLITQTDLRAKAERAGAKKLTPVDKAVAEADPPIDDGGLRRPHQILGTGKIWCGPDTGNFSGRPDQVCQICGESQGIPKGAVCLMCDRVTGEAVRRPKQPKKRKERAA